MIIDNVSLEDLSEVNKLEQKVFKNDAFAKELIKKLIQNNTFFLKMKKSEFKKKIIGFIIIVKDRQDRVNIVNFLINPKYQNNGFGAILLKHALDKIKELEAIKKVVLNVKTNNEVAIKLYEKFNFKIDEEIEKYYRSKESAYFMELDINDNQVK